MSWTFEKVDIELLDNLNLNSHEKLIYVICKSFEFAPNGCRISHKYLMKRTGVKTVATLTKCLDRLTLFGLLARKQINNGTNHYVFDKNQMQDYIQHNLNKRRKITLAKKKQQKDYAINDPKVVHIVTNKK